MTTHTYVILDDNTIEMWGPGQPLTEPPALRQPFNPKTNLPWNNREEAEFWINDFIAKEVKLIEDRLAAENIATATGEETSVVG